MARKKNSHQKHQKDVCEEEFSEEELKTDHQKTKNCSHISKAVNLSRLKKSLKGITNTAKCKDCKEAELPVVPINDTACDEVSVNEIWLCLQCGYYGCGRHSTQQHAVQHFKTPHSDCHSVVLGLTSTSTWCYLCDSEVRPDASRSLKECIEFIIKHKDKKVPNHVLVNGDKKGLPKQTSSEKAPSGSEKAEKELAVSKPKEKESKKNPGLNKNVFPPITRTIKGLKNLRNTCFFNAVLQNLCQTPWLYLELEQRSEKGFMWELPYPIDEKVHNEEAPVKFILSECYPLTQAFVNFLKVMNKTGPHVQKNETFNPSSLFEQLCKKSPQFCGFHQQDSHELLRQLLDGIRNEEIKRQRKAVLKTFNINDRRNSEDIDENTKSLIKSYGGFASHTIIERIFGGQLLSTVVCEECKGSSQVFEPFMDLSLPLVEDRTVHTGKSNDDYGMQAIAKKKFADNSSSMSKHQERKLRHQARKSSKKMAKSRSCNNPPLKESEAKENISIVMEDITEKSIEKESEVGSMNGNPEGESNDDLDADALTDDNNDAGSISKCVLADDIPKDLDCAMDASDSQDGHNSEMKTTVVLEELCNQITEIRIRRDSDKQDDLLESMDEFRRISNKQRKSRHSVDLSDILDQEGSVDWSHSQSDEQAKEWILRSLTTLKARYEPGPKECSVNSCLSQFTATERLTGNNKFRCENCTKLLHETTGKSSEVVYSDASKQLLIFSPPAVLTLHLKRFQQICEVRHFLIWLNCDVAELNRKHLEAGLSLRKLNSFVEFPEILDLAPYCSSLCLRLPHMSDVQDEVLYSLYGIVQHSGRLTSGHYIAYIKLQDNQANPQFFNNLPMGQYNLEQLLDKISKVKLPNDLPYRMSDSTLYKWYYISDGMFKEVSQSEVMQCQAYLLFYQRIK